MNPVFKNMAREEYNKIINKGERLEQQIIEYSSYFPFPNKIKDVVDLAPKYNSWIHNIGMLNIWLTLSPSEQYFIRSPFSVYQYASKKNEMEYLRDMLRAVQDRMMILHNTHIRKTKGPIFCDPVIINNDNITFSDKKVKFTHKRLKLLLTIKKCKRIKGPELTKILGQKYQVISNAVNGINERFRKATKLNYDLIINSKKDGYTFNNGIFKVQ